MIGAVAAAAIVAAAPLPATAEIAFNHSGGIELMRSDGSGVVRITEPGAQTGDGEPAWSPDGSRLAFVRTFDRGGELGHLSHIRVLDAAGERPLTGQSEDLLQSPAWSPDGRQIAFARQLDWDQPYRSEIVVIPVDGGPERVVWRQRQDERSTDVGQPACFYNDEL